MWLQVAAAGLRRGSGGASPLRSGFGRRPRGERALGINRAWLRWTLAALVGLGVAVGGYEWHYRSTRFLSVGDADVAGHVVYVYPPARGVLATWSAPVGRHVRAGQVIGTVRTPQDARLPNEPCGTGSFVQPLAGVALKAPVSGVVVKNYGVVGEQVDPSLGQPVAAVVEPHNLWIVADVPEGSIWRVHDGQRAAVHVDAVPGKLFRGRVVAIQQATQSAFALIPPSDGSGTFVKIVQRLPIKIALANTRGLSPGMSAEVRIRLR